MKIAGIILLAASTVAFASSAASPATHLDERARDRLRYQLESLHDEADLLIKNRNVDQSDVNRQQKTLDELRIYERIPLKEDLSGLQKELASSALKKNVKLTKFQVTDRSKTAPKPPKTVFSDTGSVFRLSPEQSVEQIGFKTHVTGSRGEVEAWIDSWLNDQLRLVEPTGGFGKYPMTQIGSHPASDPKSEWVVSGTAFCYRDVQFPRILLRDPSEVLPDWAKKDPQAFAREEPLLWKIVEETRKLQPRARPLSDLRRNFYLNDARMNFFLKKASPKKPE